MTDSWIAHTAWGDHIAHWNARRETERIAASKSKRERASSTHKAGTPPAALASTPTSETVSSGVGGHPRGG